MDESDGAESESTPSTIGSVTRGGLTFLGVAAVVVVAQTSAHTKITNATGFCIISQRYAHNDRTLSFALAKSNNKNLRKGH